MLTDKEHSHVADALANIADALVAKDEKIEELQAAIAAERERCVRWMLDFCQNAYVGRDFSEQEVVTMAHHFQTGIDPWESAAAICEGRAIRKGE